MGDCLSINFLLAARLQIRPSYPSPRLNPLSPKTFSTRSLLTLPGCCVFLHIFVEARLPLPPVSAFVFAVGVLEQHQNHSFIVEPAAAAQTSIIHSRARRQQRQRKKNRKLHKRIRSRWCRRSRVVKLIVYNRTRVVYGISKRTAVFPPRQNRPYNFLGLAASV